MEGMLTVTRQYSHLVILSKVFKTDDAVSVRVVVSDQIPELGHRQVSHNVIIRWSVLTSFLPTDVEVQAWDADASNHGVQTALKHGHVANPQHHPHCAGLDSVGLNGLRDSFSRHGVTDGVARAAVVVEVVAVAEPTSVADQDGVAHSH